MLQLFAFLKDIIGKAMSLGSHWLSNIPSSNVKPRKIRLLVYLCLVAALTIHMFIMMESVTRASSFWQSGVFPITLFLLLLTYHAWIRNYHYFAANAWITIFGSYNNVFLEATPFAFRFSNTIFVLFLFFILLVLASSDTREMLFTSFMLIWVVSHSLYQLDSFIFSLPIVLLVIATFIVCFGVLRISRINKEKDEEIQQLKEQLRMLNASIASVAHELRNPLNTLMGSLSLLNTTRIDGHRQEVQEYLESARCCGEILLSLIGSLIDAAKIRENDRLELQKKYVNLRESMSKFMLLASIQGKLKNLACVLEVSDSLPEFILLDAERFSQIIINLLGNAVKFTPTKGFVVVYIDWITASTPRAKSILQRSKDSIESFLPVVHEIKQREHELRLLIAKREPAMLIKKLSTVETLESNQDGFIKIHVIDNGIGMSTEEQAKIFSPFSQANKGIKEKFGGTGLGLWISNKIVNAMGGKIVLNSEPETGSEFIVILPSQAGFLSGRSPIPYTPNTLRRSLMEINSYLKSMKILVVMSDVVTQFETKHLLESFGAEVSLANSTFTAINLRHQKPHNYFDITFIDMGMEMFEGLKAYVTIRGDEHARQERPSYFILLDKNGLIQDQAKRKNSQHAAQQAPEPDDINGRIVQDVRDGRCVKIRQNLEIKLLTEISFRLKSKLLSSGLVMTSKKIPGSVPRGLTKDSINEEPQEDEDEEKRPEKPDRTMMKPKKLTEWGYNLQSGEIHSTPTLNAEPKSAPNQKPLTVNDSRKGSGDAKARLTHGERSSTPTKKHLEAEAPVEAVIIVPDMPKNPKTTMKKLMKFDLGLEDPVYLMKPPGDSTPMLKGLDSSGPNSPNFPSPEQSMSEGHFLIADDDAFSAMMMSNFLSKKSCTAKMVSNGREAVKEIEENYKAYDGILMDCEMPFMDGLEATMRIRQIEKEKFGGAEIPIYGMSGNASDEDRRKCLQAGMTKYFVKPLDMPHVIAEILPRIVAARITTRIQGDKLNS
jgi:signal transduction histidine kinase/CheY-like chemotaxis protein